MVMTGVCIGHTQLFSPPPPPPPPCVAYVWAALTTVLDRPEVHGTHEPERQLGLTCVYPTQGAQQLESRRRRGSCLAVGRVWCGL